MIEAREIARKTDCKVIIASSISDPYQRESLLAEAIRKRDIAFGRLRSLEELHRRNGWWVPKERIEMSEVPDEDFRKVIRSLTGEDGSLPSMN